MKALAVAFAAVLLLAACGSGKPTPAVGGSNNTSVCAYAKGVSGGHVYLEMSVSPTSMEPAECEALNGVLGGTKIEASGRLGTGHVYCRWNNIHASSRFELGVFASSPATAHSFCRTFRPGPGFKPVHFKP